MKGTFFFLFVFIAIFGLSQNVVKWSAQYSKESSEITINALIDKNWHLYSQYISPTAGPIPTKIVFEKNKLIKFKGKPIEENVHAFYDENFMAHLAVFDEKAVFKQKVKVKKSSEVKITITYMVCDNTRCLPPTDEIVTIKIDK